MTTERKAAGALDAITMEILFNALRSVTDETFIALMRSAYSTNIKERRDHSTAICDPEGRLIVQAEHSLPIHLASMIGMMASIRAKVPLAEIAEGDLFVANDPHAAGGTHLPDINMAMPVFVDGRLVAFMCNIAHHADVGGMAPGSMAGGMSEIYQEGIRIPVIRLFRKGELQRDIFDLLLLNVRLPEERRGDYYAQISACRLGARRLVEISGQYGVAVVERGFRDMVARTERRMRDAVAGIPDGVYRFEDVMDDDGLGAVDIPIRLVVTVSGDRIRFDFTGTAPQVRGNINVTVNATQASVCYSLKALLDPEVPNNQGVLDVCEIVTERGSLLDCVAPSPVAARANTCQRIVDVVIGALKDALPDAAVGAANGANTTAVFSGRDPATGRDYLYLETLGGGFGGRNDRDGKDGVQVHITNTSNLPVEAIEMEYPLRVVRYGLVDDSGGAGRYRGGLGLRRVITPVGHDCLFNGAGERFRNAPWGVFGGEPGGMGRFVHIDGNGREETLDIKPSGIAVKAGDQIVVETPGAGGYGDPATRDADAVEEDRRSGKFSAAWLKEKYGG
jgi:N-methylhydantoinase B